MPARVRLHRPEIDALDGDRFVESHPLYVPDPVWLSRDGCRLMYSLVQRHDREWKVGRPHQHDFLSKFVALSAGDSRSVDLFATKRCLTPDEEKKKQSRAQAVLKFAQRFGVLAICEHSEPLSHNHNGYCLSLGFPDQCWEPIERWMYYSARIAALLRLASDVKRGDPRALGSPEDWATLRALDPSFQTGPWGRGLSGARNAIRYEVNSLLDCGGVTLSLDWDAKIKRWVLATARYTELSIFGPLALEVALTISDTANLYCCSGCGVPYVRAKKAPKAGCNNYCDDCGVDRARLDAKKRYRERLRRERAF